MRGDFKLLGHALANLVNFSGRAQRSEFFIFVIAVMVVGLPVAGLMAGQKGGSGLSQAQLILWFLAIPLFVRRLHDQGRSGWFGLIMPALLGLKLYEQMLFDARIIPSPSLGFPYNAAELVLVVAFWLFALWPGTEGANRFGPNPRAERLTTG